MVPCPIKTEVKAGFQPTISVVGPVSGWGIHTSVTIAFWKNRLIVSCCFSDCEASALHRRRWGQVSQLFDATLDSEVLGEETETSGS